MRGTGKKGEEREKKEWGQTQRAVGRLAPSREFVGHASRVCRFTFDWISVELTRRAGLTA